MTQCTLQPGAAESTPEPVEMSKHWVGPTLDSEGTQVQPETVRLVSSQHSLPQGDSDFEGEKESVAHQLEEIQRRLEKLRVEEWRLQE